MKRFLPLLVFGLLAFSFGVDVQSAIETAKSQYGMSDADIKSAAQNYLKSDNPAPVAQPIAAQNIDDSQSQSASKAKSNKSNVGEQAAANSDDGRSGIEKRFPTELKQFGYDIFSKVAVTFVPLKNVPVGTDYLLGPGDELVINLWGSVQQTFTAEVDSDGAVMLPKIGKVTVTGMSLGRATQLITAMFEKNFANFYMDITMGRLKTIEVFVLGDVKMPGRYNLSSLATVLYALYSAGGPTKLGSLRSVQLIRDGHVYRTIDMYQLLLYGDKTGDIRMMRGDTIFVPKIGETVAVRGEIKTAAIYELNDSTSLYELVVMAGKYTRNTYIKEINIVRKDIQTDKFKLKTLSYKNLDDFVAQSKKFMLEEGDIIDIKAIDDRVYNWVKISGSVRFPGQYDYSRAKDLSSLVDLAGGEIGPTYLVEVSRINNYGVLESQVIADDPAKWSKVILQTMDAVVVYSAADMAPKGIVKVSGAVVRSGDYPFSKGMTAAQVILQAGGLLPNADPLNIQIVQKGIDGKPVYIMESIQDQVQVFLTEDAQLFVMEKQTPHFVGSVKLHGQVNSQGEFPIYENETFMQFVKRIGGLGPHAYIPGIALYRGAREGQQFVDLSRQTGVDSSYIKSIIKQSDFNRLRINFDRLFRDNRSEDDVVLKDNDIIEVPDMPTEVKVIGGVYNQGSFLFKDGEALGFYLNKAGNYRKDADAGEMFVAHIDGTVTKTTDHGYRIDRGDSIIIPVHEIKETDWLKTLLDWTQVLFNVATVWKVVFN